MKILELNQMEILYGGWSWACAGGMVALAAMTGVAIVNPALAASVLLSGEGALLAAGIFHQTAIACDWY